MKKTLNHLITGGSCLMILGFLIKKLTKKDQPTIMISTTAAPQASPPTPSLKTEQSSKKEVFDTLGV